MQIYLYQWNSQCTLRLAFVNKSESYDPSVLSDTFQLRVRPARSQYHDYQLICGRAPPAPLDNIFYFRIIGIWNNLPPSVVNDADSVNSFKNRLDSHWENLELKWNYKSGIPTRYINDGAPMSSSNCQREHLRISSHK